MTYLKALIVGQPGSGKTRLAHSAVYVEDMQPTITLSINGNVDSCRDYPQDRMTVVEFTTEKTLADLGDYLDGGQKLDSVFAKKNNITAQAKTLIVDGSTEYMRRLLAGMTGLSKVKFGQLPVSTAEFKDYNLLYGAMLQFAYAAYDSFPMHVIFTCLEEEVEGSRDVSPSYIGKVRKQLTQYPLLVARTQHAGVLKEKDFKEFQIAYQAKGEQFTRDSFLLQIKPSEKMLFVKNQYALTEKSYLLNPTMQKIRDEVVKF